MFSSEHHFNETESDCCDIFHFVNKITCFGYSSENTVKHNDFTPSDFLDLEKNLFSFSFQKKSPRAPPF